MHSCWIAVGAGDKGAIWAFVVPMLLVVLVRSLACNAFHIYQPFRFSISSDNCSSSFREYTSVFMHAVFMTETLLLYIQANIFFLLAALRSVYNLKKSTMQQTGKKESLQLFS